MTRVVLLTILSEGYDFPPFGIGTLAASVSDLNVAVSIIGVPASTPLPVILSKVVQTKPDGIGLSFYIWNETQLLELAKKMRGSLPETAIFAGGPQIDANSTTYIKMIDDGVLDLVITGEGEVSFRKLCKSLIDAKGHAREVTSAFGWKKNGVIRGESIELDLLRHPARSMKQFARSIRTSKLGHIEGSRGCPFTCSFCDQGWRKVRKRSLHLVLSDLDLIKSNGGKEVCFLDPTFNFDKRRLLAILDKIKSQGMKLVAEVKADLLNDEEIDALIQLKGSSLEIGLQSSNPNTLANIGRPTNFDKLSYAVSKLSQQKLNITVNTIFGLPHEGIDDWRKSVDYAYRLGNVHITSSWLKILPNTNMWNNRIKHGFEIDHESMGRLHSSDTWSYEELAFTAFMSRRLSMIQKAPKPARVRIVREIERNYGGSLSAYLEHHSLQKFDNWNNRRKTMQHV